MTARTLLLPLALLPLALLAAPADQSAGAMASQHAMADADQVKWGPGPAGLPAGAQAAVLSGHPGKAGPFTIRLKAPPGYRIGRHWHPTDELVTVLQGDFHLDMGSGSGAHSHDFSSGGYALLPAKMQHAASTRGGAVVQVSGMGPFEIHYVDPKDDPRTGKAK
ncbi:MAG: cupin domain-containing protein [Lysobacter sp.]|nr:cupin domain-containing protein [Lysobacter sp.]